MWAAMNGMIALVQALLRVGQMVNAVDKDRETALIGAEQADRDDIAALLRWYEQ